MEVIADKKVAQVVAENIQAAHVFKKHGIDFCCGGGISIEKACIKNRVELKVLMEDLKKIDQPVDRKTDYNNWSLDFLIDHIINIHHTYVKESLPILEEYANKVAFVHGHHYKELLKIKEIALEVCNELSSHLQKEERILFPYVKYLAQIEQNDLKMEAAPFGSAASPIKVMEMEHEAVGNAFKELRKLSNDFTPPEDACNTYRALYALMEEFEADLHQHIHLENNILFPKAIALEAKLSERKI